VTEQEQAADIADAGRQDPEEALRDARRRAAPRPGPRPGPGERPWLTPGRLLSLVAVLVGAWAAIAIFSALRTLLVMMLVALFLSFAMEPAVQWLDRHGWRRGPATGLVFLGMFLALAVVVTAFTTLVIDQVRGLLTSVPELIDNLAIRFDSEFLSNLGASPELNAQITQLSGSLGSRVQNLVLGAASNVVNIGRTAFGVLFQLLSIMLVTFYLVADGPRARQVLARPLPPDRQREMLAVWELAVAKTGGYLYSRVVMATVAAVTTAGFLFVFGIPYAIALGILVGTTSVFIPVIGTYVGGVLVLLVAFVDQAGRGERPTNLLWAAVFLIIYQQIENYFIAPRIQARTMDVHPAVAFVSVLVGGTLLGAVGALLALPATAILQAVLSTYVRRHQLISELAEVHLPEDPPSPRERRPLVPLVRRRGEAEAGR
jgi:predicted PurR-regulated permease PerM